MGEGLQCWYFSLTIMRSCKLSDSIRLNGDFIVLQKFLSANQSREKNDFHFQWNLHVSRGSKLSLTDWGNSAELLASLALELQLLFRRPFKH